MTSRQIISRLKAEGWILVNTKGSHQQFKNPQKQGRVTVPHPKKDLPVGTLYGAFVVIGVTLASTKKPFIIIADKDST